MPLILLVVLSLAAGLGVSIAATRYPTTGVAPTVTDGAGRRRRLNRRLDPSTATGSALSLALVCAMAGTLLIAALAYVVSSGSLLGGIDRGAAGWAHRHAGVISTAGLNLITELGATRTAAAIAVVVAVVESIRLPNRWIVPFLAFILVGDNLLTLVIKDLAHRARPTINPLATTLGPSFPSGHSSTAAAFYAAAALLLARGRPRHVQACLAGTAATIAVAVAGSRVLLDVHWLSDVVAGLALGWVWFSVCAIAFGGRLLRLGATASPRARRDTAKLAEPAARVRGTERGHTVDIDEPSALASNSDKPNVSAPPQRAVTPQQSSTHSHPA